MATPPTHATYSTPAVGFAVATTPKTTPTFNVTINDIVVVILNAEDMADVFSTPTTTGSISWTLRQSIQVANYCAMYVWTGVVNTTQTGITVTCARTSGSWYFGFGVTVWTAHGGLGVTGKANAAGAPALALTCSANSSITTGSDDWNTVDGTTRTWLTVGASPMTETLYSLVASHYTIYSAYTADVGAAGSKTAGMSLPTGQAYSIVGVEILGVAVAAYPFGVTTPTPRYSTGISPVYG